MEAPWLSRALRFLGEHEYSGKRDNQFILDCFGFTSYEASHDEVPWCAAFVCRMLEEAGYKSTRSAAARSYIDYGTACDLKPGAIVVFRWASGSRHVSFIHHLVDGGYIGCLGGNQSDMVKISVFSERWIESVRWPVKKVTV